MDTKSNSFSDRLLTLALLQRDAGERIEALQKARDEAYAKHLKALDDSLAQEKARTEQAMAQFKADVKAYFIETGDKDLGLPGVTIRREPADWDYDEDTVAALALKHQPELLRTSLKKNDLKALLRGTPPEWLSGVTKPLPTDYDIAVGKLGDLVIAAETGRVGEVLPSATLTVSAEAAAD